MSTDGRAQLVRRMIDEWKTPSRQKLLLALVDSDSGLSVEEVAKIFMPRKTSGFDPLADPNAKMEELHLGRAREEASRLRKACEEYFGKHTDLPEVFEVTEARHQNPRVYRLAWHPRHPIQTRTGAVTHSPDVIVGASSCAASLSITENSEVVWNQVTNHLLIPSTPFLNLFRDELRNQPIFNIGEDHAFREHPRDDAVAERSDPYPHDYKESLDKFLNDGKAENCLFTVFPEEHSAVLDGPFKRDLIGKLVYRRKRVICFESGTSLLSVVRDERLEDNNPICVIETRHEDAARELIEIVFRRDFSANVHIVVMPGPDSPGLNRRWRVYGEFLSNLLMRRMRGSVTSEGSWKDAFAQMYAKSKVQVTLRRPPRTWLPEEAQEAASDLVSRCNFLDESCSTTFLCGNDDLALEALKLMRNAPGGEAAITSGRLLFVGFDGGSGMMEQFTSGKVFGATVAVDYPTMVRKAGEVKHPYKIDPIQVRYDLRPFFKGLL